MVKISNIIKCILVVLILFNIIMLDTNIVHALSDVTVNPDLWLQEDKNVGQKELKDKARPILSIIRTVGIVVSVITFTIIGFKIMFSSLEEKAAYKQTMIPWLIGAAMLFTMSTLPGIIYDIVKTDNSNSNVDYITLQKGTTTIYCKEGMQMYFSELTKSWMCSGQEWQYCSCGHERGRTVSTGDTKEYCKNGRIMDTSVYPYKCTKSDECGCENEWGYSAWTCRWCEKQLSEINGQYLCQWCGRLYGF